MKPELSKKSIESGVLRLVWLALVAPAAGGIAGAFQRNSALQQLLRPTCVAVGAAAGYLGWDRNRHTFLFLNRTYADRFSRQNGGRAIAA